MLSASANNCIVIDPGAEPERIIHEITNVGLTPEFILLTHGHHDHIGAVKHLLVRLPEMRVYIGATDI